MTDALLVDMLKCARCGKCRSLCPSFQTGNSKWETTSARGRVLLSLGLAQKKIPITEQLISDIYSCFVCKFCSESCPSDVDVPRIIEKTRNSIYEHGLLPNPIQLLLRNLDESRNIFALDQDDRLLWATNVEEILQNRINQKADIAFFVGCLGSFKGTLATIPEALVLILDKLNLDFTLLGEEEWCCGNPYFIAGSTNPIVQEFVEHNITRMQELGVKTLITTCPGCYRVWRNIYPTIHGTLPFRVLHSTQFLAELLAENKLHFSRPLSKMIAYQDPCELGRHCGEYDAPRTVLKAIPALKLVDLENAKTTAECCGGGGLVKAVHPQLAINQAHNKVIKYDSSAIDLIITACPSCFDNYQTSLDSCHIKITVKDLNELVAEQLNLS